MNILSVGGYYKPNNGGKAKRISTMCEEFAALKHNVVVAVLNYENMPKKEVINNVIVLRFKDFNEILENYLNIIKEYNIDVVLIHLETYLRKLAKLNKNVKIFYECHAIEPDRNKLKEFVKYFFRKRYFSKYCSGIFVLSNNAKKVICKKYKLSPNKVHFTPNGLEKQKYNIKPFVFSENEKFVYGYAGTLYEFQGIDNILKYSPKILSIADDVEIVIVGGGPLKNQVEAFIKENNLENKIKYIGEVDRNRFDELISEFDCLLMPRPSMHSTESAIPLKIFDAAIHKKPVVMSNVSGLTEAFDENCALIYNTKTPDDFVDCCKTIYRNKKLAQKLVLGEEEALKNWPSVTDVALIQLNEMQKSLS